MSHYSEEHIFNYLDRALSPEQVTDFENEMKRDPDLKAMVEQLRTPHEYLSDNTFEFAPTQLSDRVMTEVKKISKEPYYRPTGLFSNSGFLLVSGILTALVAFLSIIQGGYLDLNSFVPIDSGTTLLKQWSLDGLITKKTITNTMIVIYGVLALALFDRFVLNPFFKRKPKQMGFN
jgi:hypothetical protein